MRLFGHIGRYSNREKLHRRLGFFSLIGLFLLVMVGDLTAREQRQNLISPLPSPSPVVAEAQAEEKTSYNWDEVIGIIVEEFKPLGREVTAQAIAIANCESGFEQYATNNWNRDGSKDHSVFQLNDHWGLSFATLYDARENIKFAKKIYERNHTWKSWACARKLRLK